MDFGRFLHVVLRGQMMPVGGVCVIGTLFVIARLMMLGRFLVVRRRMLIVCRRLSMVIGALMLSHISLRKFVFSGIIESFTKSSDARDVILDFVTLEVM